MQASAISASKNNDPYKVSFPKKEGHGSFAGRVTRQYAGIVGGVAVIGAGVAVIVLTALFYHHIAHIKYPNVLNPGGALALLTLTTLGSAVGGGGIIGGTALTGIFSHFAHQEEAVHLKLCHINTDPLRNLGRETIEEILQLFKDCHRWLTYENLLPTEQATIEALKIVLKTFVENELSSDGTVLRELILQSMESADMKVEDLNEEKKARYQTMIDTRTYSEL